MGINKNIQKHIRTANYKYSLFFISTCLQYRIIFIVGNCYMYTTPAAFLIPLPSSFPAPSISWSPSPFPKLFPFLKIPYFSIPFAFLSSPSVVLLSTCKRLYFPLSILYYLYPYIIYIFILFISILYYLYSHIRNQVIFNLCV